MKDKWYSNYMEYISAWVALTFLAWYVGERVRLFRNRETRSGVIRRATDHMHNLGLIGAVLIILYLLFYIITEI
jgi:hypothetical protein